MKKDRLTTLGRNTDVVKEFQYIEDITIKITDKELIVNFIADNKIDKAKIDSYYFVSKILKAVELFAEEINLIPKLLFNNELWIIKN